MSPIAITDQLTATHLDNNDNHHAHHDKSSSSSSIKKLSSEQIIQMENGYSAHNYHPLPV
jgi:hypothetical protein